MNWGKTCLILVLRLKMLVAFKRRVLPGHRILIGGHSPPLSWELRVTQGAVCGKPVAGTGVCGGPVRSNGEFDLQSIRNSIR